MIPDRRQPNQESIGEINMEIRISRKNHKSIVVNISEKHMEKLSETLVAMIAIDSNPLLEA